MNIQKKNCVSYKNVCMPKMSSQKKKLLLASKKISKIYFENITIKNTPNPQIIITKCAEQ